MALIYRPTYATCRNNGLPAIFLFVHLSKPLFLYYENKTEEENQSLIFKLIDEGDILSFSLSTFIQAFYGVENPRYLFMYDFGNGLMA